MRRKQQAVSTAAFYISVIGLFILGTWLGNSAVAAFAQSASIPKRHRIVLDAGHGGEDGGAVSCTGKPESRYNLEITLRLNDLLHLLGYDTVMIRQDDSSVYQSGQTIAQRKLSDLKERVRIANRGTSAVLVSIHQNQFGEEKYSGAQVFYAETKGSRLLAEQIQGSFVQMLNPGSRRSAKQGTGIYLLEKVRVPGVLVECGFLSNFEEERKLSSAEYQQKIASLIAADVSTFLEGLDQ